MQSYFDTLSAHLPGDLDFDAISSSENSPFNLISLGSDDLIISRNTSTGDSISKELSLDHGYTKIALHPDGDHFIMGGYSKKIYQFKFSTFAQSQPQLIHECLGNILNLKYSSSGRYICAGTEEQKTIIIDRKEKKKTKCRPGHQNKIFNTFFSPNEKYIVSLGQDCMCLVYDLSSGEPLESYRTKFCVELPQMFLHLSGCFSKDVEQPKIFIPGLNQLQEIEFLNNRWSLKKTSIIHSDPIICCEVLNKNIIATSSCKNVEIWSIEEYERLIAFEDFPLLKIKLVDNTFYGSRNDGPLYAYNRPLPKVSNEVQEMQEQESLLKFGDEQKVNVEEEDEQEQSEEQQQIRYITSKKTKADRIINVFPQSILTRCTQFYDDRRFLFINTVGYIFQSREVDESNIFMQIQHHSGDHQKNQIRNILKNKERERQYRFFALNSDVTAYASQIQFGLKFDQFTSWQKNWMDIQGIALGGNWMAVANFSEIKFFDLTGNQIKSVCFDRIILHMEAYENLLVVVYHESIPIDRSQNLAMQIFSVTSYNAVNICRCHVPISPQSTLKWFGFSKQGMIFSHDTYGNLRAFSFENNQWTNILTETNMDQRKIWIVGVENYNLIFWKITDSDPEPTVRPRLNLKKTSFVLNTLEFEYEKEEIFLYSSLLWQRYCLDHQKARWRLWGRHKKSRNPENVNFELSQSILEEKQINQSNLNLDRKFFRIVESYRKSNQILRAVNIVKSCIRSIQMITDMMEYFDDQGLRTEAAIDLQNFIDQKKRQMEYQAMQELKLDALRKKASVQIRPQKVNPMNPKNRKPIQTPLPHFTMSQSSQNSMILEDITDKAEQNSKLEEKMFQNPLLKKNASKQATKKQHISEQIEKFGVVKKRVEERSNKNK